MRVMVQVGTYHRRGRYVRTHWRLPKRPYVHVVDGEQKVNWRGRIVWMSPLDAIVAQQNADGTGIGPGMLGATRDLARRMAADDSDNLRVRLLAKKMAAGKPMDPVLIEVDPHSETWLRSDGMHRSKAAMTLGIRRVPVAFIREPDAATPTSRGKPAPRADPDMGGR